MISKYLAPAFLFLLSAYWTIAFKTSGNELHLLSAQVFGAALLLWVAIK